MHEECQSAGIESPQIRKFLFFISATSLTSFPPGLNKPSRMRWTQRLPSNYTEGVLQLLVPGMTMGETVGFDINSQNHILSIPVRIRRASPPAALRRSCGNSTQAASSLRSGGRTITPCPSPTLSGLTSDDI